MIGQNVTFEMNFVRNDIRNEFRTVLFDIRCSIGNTMIRYRLQTARTPDTRDRLQRASAKVPEVHWSRLCSIRVQRNNRSTDNYYTASTVLRIKNSGIRLIFIGMYIGTVPLQMTGSKVQYCIADFFLRFKVF